MMNSEALDLIVKILIDNLGIIDHLKEILDQRNNQLDLWLLDNQ